MAGDAELCLGGGVGSLVGQDHAVRNLLDETGAEDRRRNSEDQVVVRRLRVEVGLGQDASGGPRPPVMVAVLCTPPSRVPSGLNLNRASRTGPFSVMKNGTVSVPPSFLANPTCGFTK